MNAILCATGVVLAGVTFVLVPVQDALIALAYIGVLTVLSAIDFRERLLPDLLTLPLLLAGLALSFTGIGPSPLSSAAGAAIGWAGLAALAYFYRRVRGFEGLGLGDAKLLGALGAWCGAVMIPTLVLFAACFALIYYLATRLGRGSMNRTDEMPFGPFLALAGWCGFVITRAEIHSFADLLFVIKMS